MSRNPWNDLGHTRRDVYDVGEDVRRLTGMLDALDGEAMTVAAVDGYLTALALFREPVQVDGAGVQRRRPDRTGRKAGA